MAPSWIFALGALPAKKIRKIVFLIYEKHVQNKKSGLLSLYLA